MSARNEGLLEAVASENQALIDALRSAGKVRIEEVHNRGVAAKIAVTDGGTVLSIRDLVEEWRDRPRERRGTAKLLTLDSLAAYILREADHPSNVALFARWAPTPAIEAVLDHNEPQPTWRQYRAIYEFPLTPEWKAWIDFAGKERSQRDFAVFLEERAIDIVIATTENAIGYAERASVRLSLVIPGVDRFLRDAVTEAAESVAEKTGSALFFGTDAGMRQPGDG